MTPHAPAGPRWLITEKIMSKTNDTSKPTALEDDRPLADSKLDAVSGGLVVLAIIQPLIALRIDPGLPANAAAMAAWNTLLRQNGF
jgi:hypothetical protein